MKGAGLFLARPWARLSDSHDTRFRIRGENAVVRGQPIAQPVRIADVQQAQSSERRGYVSASRRSVRGGRGAEREAGLGA
jgi:hypothetical protein